MVPQGTNEDLLERCAACHWASSAPADFPLLPLPSRSARKAPADQITAYTAFTAFVYAVTQKCHRPKEGVVTERRISFDR